MCPHGLTSNTRPRARGQSITRFHADSKKGPHLKSASSLTDRPKIVQFGSKNTCFRLAGAFVSYFPPYIHKNVHRSKAMPVALPQPPENPSSILRHLSRSIPCPAAVPLLLPLRKLRFPFTPPNFANLPIKAHNLTYFSSSFTRLLPYTQKMCRRPFLV